MSRCATRTRARSLAERASLLAAAAALTLTSACSTDDQTAPGAELAATPSPGDASGVDTGSLSFALTAQPGVELNAFNYVITGPNFSKTDGIDVSHSSTVATLVGGIPAGPGYSLTLMGKAVLPAQGDCSGSTTFTIVAGAVTKVPLTVSCHLSGPLPPSNVPIPPLAVVVLGFLLLALGTTAAKRRDRPLDA